MSRIRTAALAALALAALAALAPQSQAAAPVPAGGAKAVTFPYPAKAPVVVQVNGLGATRERFRTMLKAAVPNDAADAEKELDAALGELLAGRKLDAVPKDGRVFFVVHDIAALFDNTVAVSVLLPVTSYKEFRETFLTAEERKTFEAGKGGVDEVKLTAFGQERAVHLVDLKDYVAISPDKGTAETFAGKYTKATTAAMSAEIARAFAESDVSVYVNLEVINDLYGQQIKAVKGLIDFAFMQAGMGGMLPGMSKQQMEAAKTMVKGVIQGIEDGKALVLSLEFRPEGVAAGLKVQFAEDTDAEALTKSERPGSLADLGKLPTGQSYYTCNRLGKKLSAALAGLNPQFMPAEDDEEGNAAIGKFQKQLLAAGPEVEVSAGGEPGTSITVGAYSDAKKGLAAIVGSYKAMKAGGRIQTVVLKAAPKVTEKARKHQWGDFTQIDLAFDFEATVKGLPDELREATLAQMKRLVSEKMTVWVGTDGKSVVQLAAKDWDAAAKSLDDYLGTNRVEKDAGFRAARAGLPPQANYALLFETGHTLTMMVDSLRAASGAIPNFPKLGKLKPAKGGQTYLGVALVLKGDTASASLFVPAGAIAAARDMMKGLFRKVE